jgi:glycyl-tRNA synthetase
MEDNQNKMEKIVSLCKRRGFVFQGSEIYGGLAGTYDYGPLGLAIKKHIERLWWKQFVDDRTDMYGIDSSLISSAAVWNASGHTSTFHDPLVEDLKTKKRYRADHLLEDAGHTAEGLSLSELTAKLKEHDVKSPDGNPISEPKVFNLLFPVYMGAIQSEDSLAYLRGETAQGMFTNFKNILDSFSPKLPFGIAQIGRSFRNEIAPRDYIFRVRELEIMEFEYFIQESEWEAEFEKWRAEYHTWFKSLGFTTDDYKEVELDEKDRAHYSKRTMDFYFNYSFGFKEIGGIAYRTDFDLKNHMEKSGVDMRYMDAQTNEKFIPHVIEPTFGLGRTVLAVIAKAYTEDEMGGETRIVLKLPKHLAPYRAAVSPLLKNKPELVEKAREVFVMLKKTFGNIVWDDNGNIGKRYRRQDEIGTPACIVIDFETLGDEKPELKNTVTVRDRDTGEQVRMHIAEIPAYLEGFKS